MKTYKETIKKYYKYTNWKQPTLTSNGTMGGSSFAVNQSTYYNNKTLAFTCFNGDTTKIGEANRWQINAVNTSTEYYIYWYNPIPLRISNLKIWNSETNYTVKNYVLYGSNNNSTWETITSGTNTSHGESASWNIAVSTNNMYKYFRLGCKPNNATSLQIAEIQITAQYIGEGSKSDYDFYEDVDIYKTPAKLTRFYYKYELFDWTQPKLTSNGTMGGGNFAVTAKTNNGYPPYLAFDGSTGTSYSSAEYDGSVQWFTFYNPIPLVVTSINVNQAVEHYYYSKSITVQGSNDNSTWTDITTWKGTGYTATFTINMASNTKAYKYYRLYCTDRSYFSSHYTNWRLVEITITAKQKEIVESNISSYDFYEDKYVYKAYEGE